MQNPTGTACAAAPRFLQTPARAGSLRAASGRFLNPSPKIFFLTGISSRRSALSAAWIVTLRRHNVGAMFALRALAHVAHAATSPVRLLTGGGGGGGRPDSPRRSGTPVRGTRVRAARAPHLVRCACLPTTHGVRPGREGLSRVLNNPTRAQLRGESSHTARAMASPLFSACRWSASARAGGATHGASGAPVRPKPRPCPLEPCRWAQTERLGGTCATGAAREGSSRARGAARLTPAQRALSRGERWVGLAYALPLRGRRRRGWGAGRNSGGRSRRAAASRGRWHG